jgi:shikimate dehydrogenase
MSASGLAGFVAGLDSCWRGLSVTMPLKVAVLDLGEVDPVARRAGAGNTLILSDRGNRVYNTDVGGLVWAVRRVTPDPIRRVTILGTGATARSAVLSMAELGAEQVTVMARTPANAAPLEALGRDLGVPVETRPWTPALPTADLVVSTVTAGAADSVAEAAAASAPVIFDAIYAPWPTALAEAAGRAGGAVINGLDLLVAQALLQIELMTERPVSADLLYAALAKRAG